MSLWLPCTLFAKGLAPLNPSCQGEVNGNLKSCAADFNFKNLRGDEVRARPLAGQVIVLHFWATWCEPCRQELPALLALERKLKGSKIKLITVSLDTDKNAVVAFYRGLAAPSLSLIDLDQRVSSLYGTTKVPETFIISRQGKITDKIIGVYHWDDDLIANYLSCLAGNAPCQLQH